ncbi:hypothetical protein McpSp1_09020 [Methanocorpusculaceae archaeon Sp1]|nr:hypothetical protein [Methanocorpusculaceae archaeon Sp1]
MRVKFNTISQVINRSNPAMSLPNTSIHDAYALKFRMKIKNSWGAAVTPEMEDILKSIEQIVVTTDSTKVNYSLSGLDLARRSAVSSAMGTDRVIDRTFTSLADGASVDVSFVLYLDEGDIIASAHDQIELKVAFLQNVKQGTGEDAAKKIELVDPECKLTIVENIPTAEEFYSKYGQKLELVAEPKVYAITTTCPANTEFTDIMDLPTGTLLGGSMVHFEGGTPELVGLIRTTPDRIELKKVDWDTMRAIDERRFRTKIPAGLINFDYGVQWQSNGVGKDAWNFSKGDVRLAAKTNNPLTIRYVSFEKIVNTAVYDKLYPFTQY